MWIPVRTFLCVEKLQTVLACIRSDDSQCSIKLQDFFPKHRYGKIAATIQTTWIPVRTRSSIRQVSQFKSRCPDASRHGPDARVSNIEIACIKSTVWTTILLIRAREASIWKLLAVNVRPSGHASQTGKIFSEIFGISVAQLSVRTAMTTVRTAPSFMKPNAHLNCQPINRCP
jgi:hypothetical protein